MGVHPLKLQFRLSRKFDVDRLVDLLGFIMDSMQFDEDMKYDLAVEKDGKDGAVQEISRSEIGENLTPQMWPGIHQVRFSNQWIKGLNVKLNLVKREDHSVLEITGEFENLAVRERLGNEISVRLESQMSSEDHAHPYFQEQERIFGSWLLAPSIAAQARPFFSSGDVGQALTAAYEVYGRLVRKLLRVAPTETARLEAILTQNPPPLIFPELSGNRLRLELKGLAQLMLGMQTWLQPKLKKPEDLPADPAAVLKYLVLLSLLVERLESAALNPAFQKRTLQKKKTASRPLRRTSVKKRAPGSKQAKTEKRAKLRVGGKSRKAKRA